LKPSARINFSAWYSIIMNIAMLLSGGVDSSVALNMLHRQGHRVTAFYLKIWLEDELSSLGSCPWEEDLSFVRTLCAQLNIPLEIISLQQVYYEKVIATVLDQIKQGYTPNPDILCNQWIKFGAFYDAIDAEFSHIATGHYAQVEQRNGRSWLRQSPDTIKDQTYFLALLNQQQLSRALFPIGHLHKHEVRAYAEEFNLPTAHRKDSQGICFLGKISFPEFLTYHLGTRAGSLIEYETGQVVGKHPGFWFYTLGQRSGIGLSGGPWYVVDKNIDDNTIFVSRTYHDLAYLRMECTIPSFHWIAEVPLVEEQVFVKIRHGKQLHPARLRVAPSGAVHLQLSEADQGLAPGQFAVIYHQSYCQGGGSMMRTSQISS
jgi:tRNA (5-methylaminomethyl-2-thiouridylate)-methyltransferase